MANEINYAEKFQSFIDKELEARSYTQWMEPNDEDVEYSGGKTIKIARTKTSGLGNYDSGAPTGSAYPKGSVKLTWDEYKIEMDRAVRFELGRTDPSDTNFITTTENVSRTFGRTQLVPEQDMYRFNKLYNVLDKNPDYGSAGTKSKHIVETTGLTAANAVDILMGVFDTVAEDSGEDVDFVCFMAKKNEQAFRSAAKNSHHAISFGNTITINGITYNKVMIVNDLPCVFVPSKRLQTVIKVNDGRTAGQEDGGIVADESSKQIEFLITNSEAPFAVGKVDSVKVFSSNEMQESDETTINFHYLYDCWLLTNQVVTTGAGIRSTQP